MPNRYDENVKDFFQSKIFKTSMKVVAGIMIAVLICVCIAVLAGTGIIASLFGQY